jgi:hypothetical protein
VLLNRGIFPLICDFLLKNKVIFKVLKLHLLYLFNFSVELNTHTLDIFVMTCYPFQFFVDARLNLIDNLLLIIGIVQKKKNPLKGFLKIGLLFRR